MTQSVVAPRRRVTDKQRDGILDLAEQGFAPKTIRKRLGVSSSTVYLIKVRNGYIQPAQRETAPVILREGRPVRRFTREEDHFIVRLRIDGVRLKRITELFAERFGYRRRHNSISVRLAMLASLDDNGLQEIA